MWGLVYLLAKFSLIVFPPQNDFMRQISQILSELTPSLEPVYIKNFKVGVAYLISSGFLKRHGQEYLHCAERTTGQVSQKFI